MSAFGYKQTFAATPSSDHSAELARQAQHGADLVQLGSGGSAEVGERLHEVAVPVQAEAVAKRSEEMPEEP